MLGMIKRWVGQEPDSTVGVTHASLAALRTPLAPRYDAGLVASLTGDHRDLLERCVRIGRVAERGRLDELPPLLAASAVVLFSKAGYPALEASSAGFALLAAICAASLAAAVLAAPDLRRMAGHPLARLRNRR